MILHSIFLFVKTHIRHNRTNTASWITTPQWVLGFWTLVLHPYVQFSALEKQNMVPLQADRQQAHKMVCLKKTLPSKCEMKTVELSFSFGNVGYFLPHICKSHYKEWHMNINRATGCTCKQFLSKCLIKALPFFRFLNLYCCFKWDISSHDLLCLMSEKWKGPAITRVYIGFIFQSTVKYTLYPVHHTFLKA